MQNQLDTLNEEVASANLEKNKLKFENRSLKNEQQHLLAQLAAEKDKADARITKHSQYVATIFESFFLNFRTLKVNLYLLFCHITGLYREATRHQMVIMSFFFY